MQLAIKQAFLERIFTPCALTTNFSNKRLGDRQWSTTLQEN
jgi:hypothetical protein